MTQPDQINPHKRSYQKPLIKVFGSVKALTASGTGKKAEGDVKSGNCPDPDRKTDQQCVGPF